MSETYWLVSVTRNNRSRLVRSSENSERSRYKLIIMDGVRVIPGRDVMITKEQLQAHKAELKDLHDRGLIELHVGNPHGRHYFSDEVSHEPARPAAPPPVPEVKTSAETVKPTAPPPPSPKPEKEVEIKVVEEVVLRPAEPDKPIDKMSKVELIDYASAVLGLSTDALKDMTKREIMEQLG